MLRPPLATFMIFAGVLLVLGSIGLLSAVIDDWEQANGSHRLQKLTVNVDRSANASSNAGLKLQEAELLAKKWSPQPITYMAQDQTKAVLGSLSASCNVLGVTENYGNFTGVQMNTGSLIAQASVEEHSRVAVIGALLADQLFHSTRVVGKTIELYGFPFKIIGVFNKGESLAQRMSDDGIPDIFIPVTTLLDVHPEARIETLQLAAKPDAAIRGESQVKSALLSIGKKPSQYRIENDVLLFTRTVQLKLLLLFGCGSIAIIMLARLIVQQFTTSFRRLRSQLIVCDWPDAFWRERYQLVKSFLVVVGLAACAAGLWELIRFRPSIAPDWIAEEIIDISFYIDKWVELWQKQALQTGYVPSQQELLAQAVSKLTLWLFAAGVLFGMPLLLLGARLWVKERVPVAVQLQRLFWYIPAAAVALFAAARWAGIHYRIDPREYAVAGIFFIFTIVHFNPSKGVNLSYVENQQKYS